MGRPPDKDVFPSALRDQGNRAGNTTLQRELGWEETKYWKVHEQLFKEGQIEKGKGYGGSVKLTRQDAWWRRQPPPPSDLQLPQRSLGTACLRPSTQSRWQSPRL